LQRQNAGALTVSTSPNFAAKWLVHRLAQFAKAHPNIDLRVSASLHHVDFAREDIDLAIRHSDGQAPGLHTTRLCAEELFPVCSPKLLESRNALRSPADLSRHTLLHVNDRQDWSKWLDAAGVKNVDQSRGPILNQASMIGVGKGFRPPRPPNRTGGFPAYGSPVGGFCIESGSRGAGRVKRDRPTPAGRP
jgi:LysR family glycine cleavage system transcriptional activator